MWERIVGWLRGLFGMDRREINEITTMLVSDKMWTAQQQWADVFYNNPSWGNQRSKTTKFAGLVASATATLAAAEIKLSAGSSARAEWIQAQIDEHVMSDIRGIIQKAAALSFVVLKPFVRDGDMFVDVVSPGLFFPTEIVGGDVLSGIFADIETVENVEYIRLETHTLDGDTVHITNRAYKANRVKQGQEVPLTVVPKWAELEPKADVPAVGRPLFAIIKMPFANQIDEKSPLPVSIYANAIDSLEKIDRLYNDFLWEMESGRRKQIFDITAVKDSRRKSSDGDSAPKTDLAHYETTDQYIVLDTGSSEKPYDDYTPEMRVDAYQRALNTQLRLLEMQTGFSAETFNFDLHGGINSSAKTATEVVSDNNNTYNTIKSIQEDGLRRGLLDLVEVFDVFAVITPELLVPAGEIAPVVEFGDSIFEDTGVEFLRRKSLADSNLLRPELLLAWYFGVDEAEAVKMMPVQGSRTGLFGQKAFSPGEDGV